MGPAERDALDVLVGWRASHATPLLKANNGLRSMLRSEGCPVEVSQRLKRLNTIIDKLTREPTMALSRMQDIGGCRAIVDSIEQLRRVEKRLCKNRPPDRVDDYITSRGVPGIARSMWSFATTTDALRYNSGRAQCMSGRWRWSG